ncbi:hypothetical protein [Halobaculum gomorrense]|uniref:Uncharacterized protein n=1 Tax=Halobaculum gomorrense TaxID=43928 RepID=A0A1M5NUW8_9EURY|nr:hypothetical protein [Halobaculum gomorrense]SHG92979.1 hypothetical protein SAMN05443636_1345 [Halobaculum gomorrense]
MARTRTTLALTAILVAAALAVGPGGAAAAATPDAPCAGVDGNRLVAYYDTDDRVGDATVYAETTLTLYVCSSGEPEPYDVAWGFDAGAVQGLEIRAEREASVVVRVTAAADSVAPAEAVTQKADLGGPTIAVQRGYSIATTVDGTSVTLQFGSQADLDAYRTANDAFASQRTRIATATGTLAAAAANGTVLATDPGAQVAVLNETNLTTAGRRLERAAFAAAAAGDAGDARTVIEGVENERSAARSAARSDLETYLEALEARGQGAATTVRLVLGGALVGGLVVGGGVGYLLARRTLAKVEIDRGVSTATQYSPKQIAVPLAIGAVALLAAAVGAVIGGGDLLTVIL